MLVQEQADKTTEAIESDLYKLFSFEIKTVLIEDGKIFETDMLENKI